jgi:hypothetical protein
MATRWGDLELLGYAVPVSSPGVRCVSGNGFSIYVAEDDQETIDSLANPPEPALTVEPIQAVAIPQLNPKTATLADVIAVVNELDGR